MILYIAGPMAGIPELNHPAFLAAQAELQACGYSILTPLSNDDGVPHEWEWYLRRDLALVVQADGLALLPGWKNSPGAQLETHVADALTIPKAPVEWWARIS